jgi:hypothetical protein
MGRENPDGRLGSTLQASMRGIEAIRRKPDAGGLQKFLGPPVQAELPLKYCIAHDIT